MSSQSITAIILGLSLFSPVAWSSSPTTGPAPVSPVDEQTPPTLFKIMPEEQIREADFLASNTLMVALFGDRAKKLYSQLGPIKPVPPLNTPYAPLSRLQAVRVKDISCFRRIPRWGNEQFRCNVLFHPSVTLDLNTDFMSITLAPIFSDEGLSQLALLQTLAGRSSAVNLFKGLCPRLSKGNFAGSNFECSYTTESDDPDDAYFPDDIYPQGVAVGWGVVGETSSEK